MSSGKRGQKNAPPKAAPSKQLPSKEMNHFKQILKLYEDKQFRKGLRLAESILKKYPDHGETLALKGLLLNCTDKKSEGLDFVRRGLRNDLKSHICWHVYGLLYRSDRDYIAAIKCYINALKHDPKNLQILRDLSLLQIQMRDMKGFVQTRRQLLDLKSSNKANWIALTLAAHLAGDHAQSLRILEAYEETIERPKEFDLEYSDILLYKNLIIEEQGNYSHALEHLTKVESQVAEKLVVQEKKAQFLFQLGRSEESEKEYRNLIKINPENRNYHLDLFKVLGITSTDQVLTSDQLTRFDSVYQQIIQENPKAIQPKFFELQFNSGEKFREKFDQFVRPSLRKGIPSLFNTLKPFYRDSDKAQIIEEVILSFVESLKQNETFPGGEKETPLTLLWTLFYLAQHYDVLGKHDVALKTIDEAIEHTPTAIDLYLVKGRIYKHAGDLQTAAQYFDKARKMDLADRYLNTKCTLYLLRADLVEQADKTIALFAKDGEISSQTNLFDMQCMWYEQECGDSYTRLNKTGRALKKYLAIDKHFADIAEDQFDFHTYSLRKMTLRAYVQLLRFEDKLYGHKRFFKASRAIIQSYLKIDDLPKRKDTQDNEADSQLTPAERKKALQKRRKAEAKRLEEERVKKELEAKAREEAKKKHGGRVIQVDEDPEGDTLVNIGNPLEKAVKYLRIIRRTCPQEIETHLLSAEVYLRKKKYLLVLQAVKKAISIDSRNPEVHKYIVRLFDNVSKEASAINPTVLSVIRSEEQELLGGVELKQYNQNFLQNNRDSLLHRVAAAEASTLLNDGTSSDEIGKLLTDLSGKGVSLENCIRVHKLLETKLNNPTLTSQYKDQAHQKFPFATFFAPPPPEQPESDNVNANNTQSDSVVSADSNDINNDAKPTPI